MEPHWQQPSHPDVIEVVFQPGLFSSYSRATRLFSPGDVIARLTAPTLTFSDPAYSTVQVGATKHVALNCDFLYVNHSCEPSIEFHVLNFDGLAESNGGCDLGTETPHPIIIEVRAASRTDSDGNVIGLRKGETLSFFYPSTEWDMDQAFECNCKTASCKGFIRGCKYLGQDEIKNYFINDHIMMLRNL